MSVLADTGAAGIQVAEHGCTGERCVCGRRDRRPEIRADFGMDSEIRQRAALIDDVVAEGHGLAQQRDFTAKYPGVGSEVASFIKLAKVRQVSLGRHTQNPTVMEDRKSTRLNSSHVAISY